ncbi:MAG: HRDC domain-containing protein [Gemmatimonadetes bacterium]|nr:HRDC domain-containing protein [Gemmatimonadota bacterium]
MTYVLIDGPDDADELRHSLSTSWRIALDCEAAGFHRYSDRLSLVQLSSTDRTFIIDPLAFDISDLLKGPLEDPEVEIVMHGADFDLRLLDRDLGIHLSGLFDTQVAAALLGESSLGLAALLEKHLGVSLAKKYQRADWARRPLPEEMLDYAASDTRHLHELAAILRRELEARGRLHWALEESRALEDVRWESSDGEDPVVKVKGARELALREVAALREALAWRDEIARDRDRAPFRVAGDPALVAAARQRPRSVSELSGIKGMNPRLARDVGEDLVDRLTRVASLPEASLEPYPRRDRNGPGRPPPEVEELAERLKSARNQRADDLGIDRGSLVPNAMLLEIARVKPRDEDALRTIPGVRNWQVEAMGGALLAVLNGR